MMSMSQHPAHPQEPAVECEYLTLAFSPTSTRLRTRWRNNGLSADFLGDYVTTFLPSEGPVGILDSRQKQIKHAVSFVANELLENAMKYHQRDVSIPIKMHLELSSDQVTVSVSNGISVSQAHTYRQFVSRLQQENADEMLMKLQEENARDSAASVSSVGLLTMISDYDAQLDWRFEPHLVQTASMTVTTVAVLPFKPVAGAAT